MPEYDPISTADEDDVRERWRQTVSGERHYEESTFMGFINDLDPSEFEDVFSQLPHPEGFIQRLRILFADQTEEGSTHPSITGDGNWRLYITPAQKGSLTDEQVLELVRQRVEGQVAFVREHDPRRIAPEIERCTHLRYEVGVPPGEGRYDDVSLRDLYSDLMREAHPDDHWYYCLSEACYAIAASFELRDWLMADWFTPRPLGWEAAYLLWWENIRYVIRDGVCRIYRD